MIVGETQAINPVNKNYSAGVAHVYQKRASGWQLTQTIAEPEMSTYSDFGYSVDISQNYAIVGAPGHSSSGAAYIYKKVNDRWVKQLRLPEKFGAKFGHSVAIVENYAIVGAINSRGNGPSWSDRGSAWVYKRVGTGDTETWTEVAHLTASDEFDRAHFGFKVDISDSYAVVSAYTAAANENYNRSGVYIFERSYEYWAETAKLQPTDAQLTDREQFGWDVNLFENQLIVGAPLDVINGKNKGSAYIFEKQVSAWSQTAKLIASSDTSAYFGRAVEIKDDIAVIGFIDNYRGAASFFLKTKKGWVQGTKLLNPDKYNNGSITVNFGTAIAFSENEVIIGQFDSSVGASIAGTVLVFNRSTLTGLNDIAQSQFSVYPNPATDVISIQFNESLNFKDKVTIEITSLFGKSVLKNNYSTSELKQGIQLPANISGIYMLTIRSGDKIGKRKIVVNI
nr:T9SS type A sorting domain-containing protein [Pontibacter sp. BT310]